LKIRSIYIAFLVIALSSFKQIDEPAETYKKIQQVYNNFKTLYLETSYSVVDVSGTPKVIESFSGKVVASGKLYFIESIDSKSIYAKGIKVLISDKEQTIIVQKRDTTDIPHIINYDVSLLDSAEKLTDKGFMEIGNKKQGVITYAPILGGFRKVDLLYNKTNYHLKGVNMFLRTSFTDQEYGEIEKPVIRVRYKKQEINQPVAQYYFSTSKYVLQSNGKYVGVGKYRNYEIINQDQVK